ncbi:MAG: tryptophan synthase subunit alpha, partial [Pseudomonadales bacterium]|nr:tryptophan synthase subunit alpha [Pseudomonadales bacterium]
MARLSTRLNEIRDSGGKALVAYLVAGDPTPETTVPLMHNMAAAGVDVFELGMPFSDPEAEGPIIQLAHERALKHRISLKV